MHTVYQYAYGMAIHTFWVYGDMKAEVTTGTSKGTSYTLAAAIYHRSEIFKIGAWNLPQQLTYFTNFLNNCYHRI